MVGRLVDGRSSTATPVSLHNPANAGDLLFGVVYQNTTGVGSVTGLTAGYGAKQIGSGATRATPLSALAVSGTGTDLAFSGTASPTVIQAVVAEFSGVSGTEDATAGFGSSGAATTVGTGTVTTVTAECLVVAWLYTSANSGVVSIDNGFNLIPAATSGRGALAYKFVSAALAYSAAWTWANSGSSAAGVHAFPIATGIPRGDLGGHVSL